MRQRRNCVERCADTAGVSSLDNHDQFSPGIARVDLRARQSFDRIGDVGKALGTHLHENTGDFDSVVVLADINYPAAVDEFAAVNISSVPRLAHGTSHFGGGPGGPLIA